MPTGNLFRNFRRLAFLATLLWLCSCGADLFSPDSREIGGGYRLKRAGNPIQFALITPHESGGLIIDEIGWHEPIIVARASGSEYWDAIDTEHAQHTRISDAQRKSDSRYQSIQIEEAETGWNNLKPHKRIW